MTKKCLVALCRNHVGPQSPLTGPNLQFFKLRPARYHSWIRAIGRDPSDNISFENVICSAHFRPEDFVLFGNRLRLKSTAIPSLKLKGQDQAMGLMTASCSLTALHTVDGSPRELKRTLDTEVKVQELVTKKLMISNNGTRIDTLNGVLDELKKRNLISDEAIEMLQLAQAEVPVALVKDLMQNTLSNFPQEFKPFAMTLQFHSSKAYDFVRATFGLTLPPPSVIRDFLTNANCEPGFATSAFDTLKAIVEENSTNNKPTICALMLDEMSIKRQIDLIDSTTWGYVDIGCGLVDDCLECATEALVPMVVSLSDNWSLPIGYFLIKSLNDDEKANVVKETLCKLAEIGVTITSVTCDGPSVHLTMAKSLGASFVDINHITPYFEHPVNRSKVYVVFDACHILKLLRNNWAALGQFKDEQGGVIDIKYLERLGELQENEGWEWKSQNMEVNLGISNSVADALEFLMDDAKMTCFKNARATIRFIRTIEKLFDLCSSRNPFGRGCKAPLRLSNEHYWRPIIDECFVYIKGLRDMEGTLLYESRNKTPMLGFLITGYSMIGIYNDYVKEGSLRYFLTHRVSQDHLELLFHNLRALNGSNIVTAYQFFNTFREILITHDLKRFETRTGDLTIDHVSLMKKYNLQPEDLHPEQDFVIPWSPLTAKKKLIKCNIKGQWTCYISYRCSIHLQDN